jgi:phosphatidylserine/phosphatidylglycerophosphate/cardiolipin synthase-like enzyme
VSACAADIEAIFGGEQKLRNVYHEAMLDAENTVELAMDVITDEWLISWLCDVAHRGREVRIITDRDFTETPQGESTLGQLLAAGCEVVGEDSHEALISRFMLIDRETVIVGSYPFTEEAADTALNDAIIITDEAIVEGYAEHFDYCWNISK